jgi:hypothetical protein
VRESPAFSTAASHKNATKFEMYISKKVDQPGSNWALGSGYSSPPGEEQIGV